MRFTLSRFIAVHSSRPHLTSPRLARRSHTVQSHVSYHQTKGRPSSAISVYRCERGNLHSRRCQVTFSQCLHQRRSRGISISGYWRHSRWSVGIILDGFRLRSDSEIVRWPDQYMDDRGREFWGRVMALRPVAPAHHGFGSAIRTARTIVPFTMRPIRLPVNSV